jgi:short-subunit dehydrogenase
MLSPRTEKIMTPGGGNPVVITGATGMSGAATAARLARRGIDTILVARDRARGDRLVEALQRTGGSHRLVVGDLSERASVRVVAAAIRSGDHHRADTSGGTS